MVETETLDGTARAAGTRDRVRRKLALAAILVTTFMDYLDVSIVNVAVPDIQRELGASDAAAQWVAAGYTLPFALILITGGRLGDSLGRKRVFLTGVLGFTAASALCALAPTAGLLVGGRVLQGIAAALMIPQVFAMIQALFPPSERAGAFSAFTVVTALASVAGAPVGGFLVEADLWGLGWRSVFLLNLVIGVVAVAAVVAFVPETETAGGARLDLGGFVLVTLGLLMLVFPLVRGADAGWPGWSIGVLAAGVPVLVAFWYHERAMARRGRTPLVEPGLLRRRSFAAGVIAILAFFAGINSFFFLFFGYLQEGLGFSALKASLIVVVWPVAIAVTSLLTMRWVVRFGRSLPMAGMLLMALSTVGTMRVITHAGGGFSGWELTPSLFLTGVGMGLVAPVLLQSVLAGVPSEDAGSASGVLTSTIQLGASIGVAVAGALYFSLLGTRSGIAGSASDVATALPGSQRAEVFTSAIADTLWYHVGLYLLTFVLLFLIPKTRKDGENR